jgi:glutamyl-tRNA reductase|tara:strand:- start:1397 stop:2671 length:1275 start_codon:yes stop_codon:yes gene_type:complete
MAKDNFVIINARVTFKNIPMHKLAHFAFKDVNVARESFMKIKDVSECVVIQTASRVEAFIVMNRPKGDIPDGRRIDGKNLVVNKIQETWIANAELEQWDIEHFDQTFEVYAGIDVIEHLLRLASGLDSVVVGKEEILNEVKESSHAARLAKHSGKILNKLFDGTIRIAINIRNSSKIGENVLSIGDIAVKLAEENAGIDGKKKVLVIGTGEIAGMVAKSMNRKGYAFDVTSQKLERATGFSKILCGNPVEFSDVLSGFNKYSIVIVSTTADYFIITFDNIKRVMKDYKKGMLILDISDPRAIEETVTKIHGIKLLFRDQIAEMDDEKLMEALKIKVSTVEGLIEKEVPILDAAMKNLEPEIVIKDVIASVDSIREKELKKALTKLGLKDKKRIKIIEDLTKSVAESIVSVPTQIPNKTPETESS